MSDVSTTKLSSRGQVVIPEEIRNRLGLEVGAQFVVIGDADTVVLKRIDPPHLKQFDALIGRARRAAKATGMKESDVASAVRSVRRGRR